MRASCGGWSSALTTIQVSHGAREPAHGTPYDRRRCRRWPTSAMHAPRPAPAASSAPRTPSSPGLSKARAPPPPPLPHPNSTMPAPVGASVVLADGAVKARRRTLRPTRAVRNNRTCVWTRKRFRALTGRLRACELRRLLLRATAARWNTSLRSQARLVAGGRAAIISNFPLVKQRSKVQAVAAPRCPPSPSGMALHAQRPRAARRR